MRSRAGLTILELLTVLAILGIVASIGVVNGRGVLAGRQERSALASIQQSVWQGATAASARGRDVRLVREGRTIRVEEVASGAWIRTEELAAGVETNLPEGTVLTFTPPGRITTTSLDALYAGEPPYVRTSAATYRLRISLIGEVAAREVP